MQKTSTRQILFFMFVLLLTNSLFKCRALCAQVKEALLFRILRRLFGWLFSPEKIIQYQIDSALDYYNSYAQSYGIDLNTFFQIFIGYESAEAFKEAYRASAEETAQYYLIYQALAESKGYKVTTEEIKEYFKEMTGSEDYSTYESAFGLPYLKAMIMYENMSNIIRSSATVVDE